MRTNPLQRAILFSLLCGLGCCGAAGAAGALLAGCGLGKGAPSMYWECELAQSYVSGGQTFARVDGFGLCATEWQAEDECGHAERECTMNLEAAGASDVACSCQCDVAAMVCP